ncbi:MAG: glycosyltransferase family 2 protein [Kiloniellales bacterium]|nr:glycosyltransferase family 2 protein [Kiloniellales bacterium]
MLSIVIPAYNEEDNVRPLYDSVIGAAAALERDFEVIVVDDGSSDATFDRLAALAADDPRLKVIKLRRNYGQTPALAAGIDHARGEILITMDADLQNDPADIGRLVAALEEGPNDLVVGWRHRRQDAWLRSWLSRVANRLIARVTGVPVRDNGCTLKAFRAELIKSVPLYSEMHRFLPALMSIRGCRLFELPVNHRPRQHGSSKYGFSRIYKVFFDLMAIKALLVFARRPLLCFFGTTAVALGLAGLSGGAALYHAMVDDGGTAVIFMALSVLLGSLTIFLALGGTIVSIAYAHFLDPGADPIPAADRSVA